MAQAKVCFAPERDAAAISWPRRPNDFPLNAINKALEYLYRNDDLAPYLYQVYNGDLNIGMVVAGNFNPESDAEIRAIFDNIVENDKNAPQSGEWAAFTVEV